MKGLLIMQKLQSGMWTLTIITRAGTWNNSISFMWKTMMWCKTKSLEQRVWHPLCHHQSPCGQFVSALLFSSHVGCECIVWPCIATFERKQEKQAFILLHTSLKHCQMGLLWSVLCNTYNWLKGCLMHWGKNKRKDIEWGYLLMVQEVQCALSWMCRGSNVNIQLKRQWLWLRLSLLFF